MSMMDLRVTLRAAFLANERLKYLSLGSVKLALERPNMVTLVLIADK